MELTDLVTLAKDCKGSGPWTSASLIRVGGLLAGKINGIQNLSGGEKCKLVQRVLLQALAEAENKEIVEQGLSKDEEQAVHDRYDVLEKVIADVLPASLELAIQAARGGLDLKKVKPSTWVKLCSCVGTAVVHQLASMNLISEAHATQARQALVKVEQKASEIAAAKEAQELPAPAPAEEKKEAETSPAASADAQVVEGTTQ